MPQKKSISNFRIALACSYVCFKSSLVIFSAFFMTWQRGACTDIVSFRAEPSPFFQTVHPHMRCLDSAAILSSYQHSTAMSIQRQQRLAYTLHHEIYAKCCVCREAASKIPDCTSGQANCSFPFYMIIHVTWCSHRCSWHLWMVAWSSFHEWISISLGKQS